MAENKKDKLEKLLRNSYELVSAELGLEGLGVNEKVHKIIDAADLVFTEICQNADTIKIHSFDEISENYPELGIPKPVWNELVNLRRLKLFTSIPEKVLEKIAASYDGAKNVTALRESMVGNVIEGDTMKVASINSDKEFEYEADYELDDKFVTILNNCATIRQKLDTILWPKITTYSEAFSFVTKDTHKTFKMLLDMQHYKGGWPAETTPPMVWKAIAGFNYVYGSMSKYGYTDQDMWAKRFGLNVTVTQPHPSHLNFGPEGEAFAKYTMFKIHDRYIKDYEKRGIKPWHHLIEFNNVIFAYIWDSRLIEVIDGTLSIPEEHRDYGIIDSCHPLVAMNQQIVEYAQSTISDIFAGSLDTDN